MYKESKYFILIALFIGVAACAKAEERQVAVEVPASAETVIKETVAVEAIPSVAEGEKEMAVVQGIIQDQEAQATDPSIASLTLSEILTKSWEASFKNEAARLEELVSACLERFDLEARQQQGLLTGFPPREGAEQYKTLNEVATCRFIKAEFLMNHGKKEEAIVKFQEIIDDYSWAQAWDPSRGAYWSVAEKSQDSIDVLTGKREEKMQQQFVKVERTQPILNDPGTEEIVDYTKFGELSNVGTEEYRFIPKDIEGLAKATGEGIYPNKSSIYNNPRYKEVRTEGRLNGSHWDFVNTNDLEAAYFKWATAPEPEGLKLYFLGLIFEKAGMPYEALRAYHALIVHFPKTTGYTYWQTPWYPAQAAIAKIRHILRLHPELELVDQWMKIQVQNGFDNVTENDKFIVYPGRIIKKNLIETVKGKLHIEEKVALGNIKRELGAGTVRLVQYENNHWQLLVDNKPYPIKAVTYAPTSVGQSPDKGTLENWMVEDTNQNEIIDGPYEAWVDANRNNTQDADEPVVGDFQLMKEMGANTLRIYHHPKKPSKELLRKMYEQYGFRVIMGDFLGKYALGSGASWTEGTDYENEAHKAGMLASVKEMVMEFKDEPYILLWVLGNENNYGVACNADKKPEAYYKFVNEVAQWIKSVDSNHPVAINNGDTLFLDIFAKHAPDVDIFTGNVYRGDYGFGSFWEQVADAVGKPAYISEFGAPAFAAHLTLEEADKAQADYHRGNWLDVEANMAGSANGVGNALGGVVFEWLDEWWKNYEPFLHDRKSDAVGPFPGGYYFEEWFGIVGQGNGRNSPFMRQPRESYYLYKELWNKL